jgi:hypothetical protein
MKISNIKIRELLEQSGTVSQPLSKSEVDKEYSLFLRKINTSTSVVAPSKKVTINQLFNINYFMTLTSKQVTAFALALVVGAASLSVGYDRALAYNLASDIKNAPNISEYDVDISFTNVLKNGKAVSKEQVSAAFAENQDKISYVGGTTEGALAKMTEEEVRQEAKDAGLSGEELAQLLEDKVVEDKKFNQAVTPAKEVPAGSDIEVVEVDSAQTASLDAADVHGFDQAERFLKLSDQNEDTYIGLNTTGEVVFFSGIQR